MNLKWVSIGTAFLVVLAVVGYYVGSRGGNASMSREGESLLGKVDISGAAKIVIAKDKEHVTLTNSSDGWHVQEAGDFIADQTKIKHFLFQLVQGRLGYRVTERPEKLTELGLQLPSEGQAGSDPKTTVFTIFDAGGKQLYQVLLGKARDASGEEIRGGRYVRVGSEPVAYLVSTALSVESKPDEWLDRSVLRLEKAKLKAVRVIPSSGPSIEVSRPAEDKPWALAGGSQLKQSALDDLLRQAASLDLASLADTNATPLTLGRAKITEVDIELFDKRVYKFRIGEVKTKGTENNAVTTEATLDAAVTDAALRAQVNDYNQRFHNRMLAMYDFDMKPFLQPRSAYLEAAQQAQPKRQATAAQHKQPQRNAGKASDK